MELKPGEGERVCVVLETETDVADMNVHLLVRRGKYPVPIKGEFDANSSVALASVVTPPSRSEIFGF